MERILEIKTTDYIAYWYLNYRVYSAKCCNKQHSKKNISIRKGIGNNKIGVNFSSALYGIETEC